MLDKTSYNSTCDSHNHKYNSGQIVLVLKNSIFFLVDE